MLCGDKVCIFESTMLPFFPWNNSDMCICVRMQKTVYDGELKSDPLEKFFSQYSRKRKWAYKLFVSCSVCFIVMYMLGLVFDHLSILCIRNSNPIYRQGVNGYTCTSIHSLCKNKNVARWEARLRYSYSEPTILLKLSRVMPCYLLASLPALVSSLHLSGISSNTVCSEYKRYMAYEKKSFLV